jgi:hypothetical protein
MTRLLTTTALILALACGTAFAAARFSAPSKAHVGDQVTAKASGLKSGRYALTLSLDNTAGPRTACLARVGHRQNAVNGRLKITGKIPPRLRCWENNSVRLGKIKVEPGKYHLIIGQPQGPSGFGPGSFVRRKLTIKR